MRGFILRRATPPNFNKIPAKIIDPKVGASTWAIGNHIWSPYKGNFTAKTQNVNTVVAALTLSPNSIFCIKNNDHVPNSTKYCRINAMKGSLKNRVIIKRRVTPFPRSGYLPHFKIITEIGNKDNS